MIIFVCNSHKGILIIGRVRLNLGHSVVLFDTETIITTKLTIPYPTLPNLPYLTLPTLPYSTLPYLTYPTLSHTTHHTLPYLTLPYATLLYFILPCPNLLYSTTPTLPHTTPHYPHLTLFDLPYPNFHHPGMDSAIVISWWNFGGVKWIESAFHSVTLPLLVGISRASSGCSWLKYWVSLFWA